MCFLAIFILKNPLVSNDSVLTAILFCVKTLVPALFPFLIINNILIDTGFAEFIGVIFAKPVRFLFGINKNCAAAILLGAISGFPMGAKCAVMLLEKKMCTKEEVERMLPYINNASPAFIIGGVGIGMLGDYKIGVLLYVSQILAAFICGVIFSYPRIPLPDASGYKGVGNTDNINITIISKSITNAALALLSICGHICFFSFVVDIILEILKPLTTNIYLYTFICGLFEITSGVKFAVLLPNNIIYIALICGFAGLSVHMQIASFVLAHKISMIKCVAGKLLQGIIMIGIVYLGVNIFNL
jgi:sporulation integral membrane protein YlbJ